MGRKRRTFTDKFKSEIALEAVKGVKTLSALAAQYRVHPNQISEWKKRLLAHAPESDTNLALMRMIDERYMRHPELGSPRMTDWLRERGRKVNPKRVARLMRKMRLAAITPGPHTSKPARGHKIYLSLANIRPR